MMKKILVGGAVLLIVFCVFFLLGTKSGNADQGTEVVIRQLKEPIESSSGEAAPMPRSDRVTCIHYFTDPVRTVCRFTFGTCTYYAETDQMECDQ